MEKTILRDRARDYRQLICYQKAEIVQTILSAFCEAHLRNDAATAKMLNVYAEDGVRLIREGAELAAKSLADEQERMEQAKNTLRQLRDKVFSLLKDNPRHPPCWTRKSPEFMDAWSFGKTHLDMHDFVQYCTGRSGFEIGNIIVVWLEQADNLIYRLIASLEERRQTFEATQKMKAARVDLTISGTNNEVVLQRDRIYHPLEPVHVGIVGLGRAGFQMHLPELKAYPNLFKIVAGCDLLTDRLERFSKACPDAKCYAHAEDLFADSQVDLVSIVVPSTLHVEYAEKALRAGKKVFLEKPIATSRQELDRLKALDGVFRGKLFIRHNRHFESCFSHVNEIIASGILGDVFEIKMRRLRHRFRDDWQTVTEFGGGQLFNWGPHLIWQALILMGSEIESEWIDAKSIASRGNAEDHVKILLKGKNARVIDIEISDSVCIPEPVITVYGTRGTLISKDERTLQLQYLPPDYAEPPKETRRQSPPLEGPFVYSAYPEPPWIKEEIPVSPANLYDMNRIYMSLYEAFSCVAPFPIKNVDAFRAMDILLQLREKSGFCPHD